MPKLTLPLFSVTASGPLARLLTFQNTRRAPVARAFASLRFSTSSAPPTPAQIARRAIYAAATVAWRALNPAAKAPYDARAKPLHITGYNVFISDALRATPTPPGTTWDNGLTTWDNGLTTWDT